MLALLVTVHGSLGCSVMDGSELLAEYAANDDATVDWDSMRPGLKGLRANLWPLPGWVFLDQASVDPSGEQVKALDLDVIMPIPLPMVLLWLSADQSILQSDGSRATNSSYWCPFAAYTTSSKWPDDEPRFRVAGVPLLYANMSYGSVGREALELHQTLFGLGPAYLSMEGRNLESRSIPNGWAAVPVHAGGLGHWLWLSLSLSAEVENKQHLRLAVHGPLGGLLGYVSYDMRRRVSRDPAESRVSESGNYLLGGLLWRASQHFDSEGRVTESIHGPLWGMFGWGRAEGRFALKLFWTSVSF